MNCLFKNMRTMCLAMIAGTLLLTVSCKDDDEATVTGFALDQTEVGFLNHGGAIEIRVATDETLTAIYLLSSNHCYGLRKRPTSTE